MKRLLRIAAASAAILALSLAAFGCSDDDDDDDKKPSQQQEGGGTQVVVPSDGIVFPVTTASKGTKDEVALSFKYDRSAKGANDLVTMKDLSIKVYVQGGDEKVKSGFPKTIAAKDIVFALDPYGAYFKDDGTTAEGANNTKTEAELATYKKTWVLGSTLSKGDKVTVKLESGDITLPRDGCPVKKDDILVALIDTSAAVDYYAELGKATVDGEETAYAPLFPKEQSEQQGDDDDDEDEQPFTVLADEASKTIQANENGETTIYSDDTDVSVKAGDLLLVKATVAYGDIAQTYAQIDLDDWASLPGVWVGNVQGTSSKDVFDIYKFKADGTLKLVKFNNMTYDSTEGATGPKKYAGDVAFTNLKVAVLPLANYPKIASAASVELPATSYTESDATKYKYQAEPTVTTGTKIKKDEVLYVSYGRDAKHGGDNYYANSVAEWMTVWTDKEIVVLVKEASKADEAGSELSWLQIGIQTGSDAKFKDSDGNDIASLTFTDVDARILPPLASLVIGE